MRASLAWILISTLVVAWVPAAPAATIAVDSTDDELDATPGRGCTLREAIVAANTNAAAFGCAAGEPGPAVVDVVTLPPGTYALTLGPRGDDAAERGDLDLADDVEIRGAGADTTAVDAGRIDRVFEVLGGVAALVTDVEIRGGDADTDNGGGIENNGDLTLERVVVTDNRALGSGGGIRNNGQLTVRASLLEANVTADHGGGIDNHGDATFESSTVSGNDGGNLGGGLYNLGGMSLTLVHVTVTGNSADSGDAIHNAGALSAGNNLIAGTCSGSVDTTLGGNLESPGDTCGLGVSDRADVADLLLAPLADNGGPTRTHALLTGSPAIDAAVSGPCPATDQRGEPRPADGDGDGDADCDAGAFEARSQATPIFTDGFESGDLSRW